MHGLTASKESSVVDIDEVDMDFVDLIKKAGGPNLQSCYQCGTCSGSCPAGARTNYLVRDIIRKALLGLKEECVSVTELWYCTTCYACTDRCPQDVKPTDVIKAIRNIAVAEGYMLKNHQKVAVKVIETGHAVPLDKEMWQQLREKVGLEAIPPNASANPWAIEEIQKLSEICKFDKLIGYQEFLKAEEEKKKEKEG